jgi:predicted nucleic acid-binding Zn ribbon protein
MRQDKKSSTHIKDVIDNIFKSSALHINLDDIRIWKVWDDVVGKKIASHARPSWIKKGVLMVKVTDSVWLQELEFMTQMIKTRLNSKLQREAIKKIRFRVGRPQDSRQKDRRRYRQEDDQRILP